MEQDQTLIRINGIQAWVKGVNVTKNGVVLTFNDVVLTGEQISQISALVSNAVYLDIKERIPDMEGKKDVTPVGQTSLFDQEEDEQEDAVSSDKEVVEQVSKELGLE